MKIRPHKIIRSKRRTIALSIASDATIVVRAPLHAPASYIENFVLKHANWITRKIQEVLNRPTQRVRRFADGEEFLYLGRPYKLEISDRPSIFIYDKLFFPASFLPQASEKIIAWYKQQAQEIISKRAEALVRQMNLKYSTIKISSAAHRWGSCSPSGNMNFTWRLMMTPIEVIDYVIVHELTHLTEKNHSGRFWTKVKAVIPDYKSRHKWLRTHDYLLHI